MQTDHQIDDLYCSECPIEFSCRTEEFCRDLERIRKRLGHPACPPDAKAATPDDVDVDWAFEEEPRQ